MPNRFRYGIEEAVTSIIALQQPVAGDLRELMSIVAITLNLERIAGPAEGIARNAIFLEDNPVAATEPDLWRMADVVREMLQSATRSFLDRDQHLARLTIDRDDEVDDIYADIHERLIARIADAEGDADESDAITHVLWCSHNLERIGDRALNICERTIFQVTGHSSALRQRVRSRLLIQPPAAFDRPPLRGKPAPHKMRGCREAAEGASHFTLCST